jgi:hypothetical protein
MKKLALHLGLVLLSAMLLACGGTFQYKSETILFPDGTVERTIEQPPEDTPASAQKPEAWKKVTITQEKVRTVTGEAPGPKTLKAQGTFPSVQLLPDSLAIRRRAGDKNKLLAALMPSAKLKRDYRKNDCVFVTEHRWHETLTDSISLASLFKGRDEIFTLGVSFAEDVFNELEGKDYDASELVGWLRSEGKSWFVEATDYLLMQYLASLRAGAPKALNLKKVNDLDALGPGFLEICERHAGRYGLKVRELAQLIKDEKNKENEQKVAKIATDFMVNICQKVRHRATKQPVSREKLLAWLKEAGFKVKEEPKQEQPRPPDGTGPQKAPKTRLELAADKVINEKYGGKLVFDARAGAILLNLVGVHFSFDTRNFDYALTMPGAVVETNGEILAVNQVRWVFKAEQAWVLGYPMSCRSVEAHADVQKQLLGKQALTSPVTMLQLVALLAEEEDLPELKKSPKPRPLRETLMACRAQQSLAPLWAHRAAVGEGGSRRQLVDRLLKLLQLPLDGK